jgi:hypothetical protein
MTHITRQFSKLLILTVGILCLNCGMLHAQRKKNKKTQEIRSGSTVSRQLAEFVKEADEAGIDFVLPPDFKELPATNNENFSFDYAMTMPGQDFEIWIRTHSLKPEWKSYEQVKNITGKSLANPDSAYIETAWAHAAALSDDGKVFTRSLPDYMLDNYNANAGKTYLLNLADLPETKHYKYALLIALQKDHTGYLMAVCLTNEKGPEFFRKINKARDCMRFR